MTFSKLGTDRDTGQLVYLPKAARVQGLYIVGLQGMGKSGLISNLVIEDIKQGTGVCVLDPKRDLIDTSIARLPSDREKDVILLDVADEDYPFGLNLFECPNLNSPSQVEKTVDRVIHIFDKLLGVDEHTPLISQYLLHCTHTLVANPGYTMADIELLLTDKNCRQQLVANVKRSQTRNFWHEYYDPMPLSDQRRERIFILRRVEKFLRDMTLPIVGQSTSTIDMRKIMDEGKILLVKLERTMEQTTTLVGSMIVALILNASASRKTQRQFHLYADEFQRFATEDFATLLEEARYAAIGITMAHQNRAQLESGEKRVEAKLRDRTLNVGNIVVFYVPTDAEELAGQFDTTPPPAWEEELEEERLEIREAERLETIEMSDGDATIHTPVLEPIQYIVNHGVHPLEHSSRFIETYGKDLLEQAKKEEDDERARLAEERRYEHDLAAGVRYYAPPLIQVTYHYRQLLKMLNTLFYEAMKAGKKSETNPSENLQQDLDDMLSSRLLILVDTFIQAFRQHKKGYRDALQAYQQLSYDVESNKIIDLSMEIERPTPFEWAQKITQDLTEITLKESDGTKYNPFTKEVSKWYQIAKSKEELLTKFENLRQANPGVFAHPEVQKVYEKYKPLLRKGPDKDRTWWKTVRECGVEQTLTLPGLQARKIELQIQLAELAEHMQENITQLEATFRRNLRNVREVRRRFLRALPGQDRKSYLYIFVAPPFSICSTIDEVLDELEKYGRGLPVVGKWHVNYWQYEKFHVRKSLEDELIEAELTVQQLNATHIEELKTEVAKEVSLKEQQIKSELALLMRIETQKPVYETFVAKFQEQMLQIMGELATPAGRIEESSGVRQPQKRQHLLLHPEKTFSHPRVAITHPQPTSAEMEKKNENQLLQLDLYQAWVKMIKNDPQNPGKECMKCGLRNANGARSCTDCNTKLPAPNEYLITTIEPEKGLYGKLLQERKTRIQGRNIQDKILRKRTDVEAEITQRQTGCSSSAPAQPQKQQPQQSSQQTSRHARNVPIHSDCPTCGKSNPTGSQFCNQCGTKLP